jgi:hypothetical protein
VPNYLFVAGLRSPENSDVQDWLSACKRKVNASIGEIEKQDIGFSGPFLSIASKPEKEVDDWRCKLSDAR